MYNTKKISWSSLSHEIQFKIIHKLHVTRIIRSKYDADCTTFCSKYGQSYIFSCFLDVSKYYGILENWWHAQMQVNIKPINLHFRIRWYCLNAVSINIFWEFAGMLQSYVFFQGGLVINLLMFFWIPEFNSTWKVIIRN